MVFYGYIVGAVAVGFVIGRETAPKPENFIGWYKVEGVIDGDTIKISGQSIRYIGVDTPETKHPQKQEWPSIKICMA